MRPDTITVQPPLFPSVPRRRREVRDPYDGLRPWSAITHGAGAVLSLAGTIYLLLRTAAEGNGLLFGLMAVYGLSMVCLYTASTLYHCLRVSVPGRLALRKQPAHLAGGAFECHPIGSCPVKVHGRRVVLFPVEDLSPVRCQKGHQPQSRRLRRSSFARVVHDCRPEWFGGISGPPAVRLHPASGRSPPASA